MSLIRIPCNNPSGCGVKFHFRGTKAACMLPRRDNPTSVALRYVTNNMPSPSAIRFDTMEPEEYKNTIAEIALEVMDDPFVQRYTDTKPEALRRGSYPNDDPRMIESTKRSNRSYYRNHMEDRGVPKDARFTDPMEDIAAEVKVQYELRDQQRKETADAKLRALGFDKSAPEDFTQEEVQRLYKTNDKLSKLRDELVEMPFYPPHGVNASDEDKKAHSDNRDRMFQEFMTELKSIGLQESKTPIKYPRNLSREDDLALLLTPKEVLPPGFSYPF